MSLPLRSVLAGLVVTASTTLFMGPAHAAGELTSHPGLDLTHSDEFEVQETLSQWTEGPSTAYDLLDIDQSTVGHLTFVPTAQNNNAWYQDFTAPFRHKTITGDFVAVTHVNAGNISDANQPPTGAFNAGGFLVRDPASTPGSANWIAYNLGRQAGALGTEAKTTINSSSTLQLTGSGGEFSGILGVCRVGDTFYTFRQFAGQTWQQTQTLTMPAAFPDAAQVGLKVNAWRNGDISATFDYIRIAEGDTITAAQCQGIIEELATYQTPIPRVFDTSLSDEFDDGTTLSQWTEGPSTDYDLLDIDGTTPGHLSWVPSDIYGNGWYQQNTAPFRFKMINGDFVAITDVDARQVGNINGAPTGYYNAAGFLLRDPASTPGNDDWIAYNIGNQAGSLATEAKYTIDSASTLMLTSTGGITDARLAICRIGETIYTWRMLEGESDWDATETLTMPGSFPDDLELGLKVNGWQNADLFATFDYIRAASGHDLSPADCLPLADALAAEAPTGSLILD